jgi:hypothetical protein
MSVISDRKSIGTSILKSNSSFREDSMRKSKQIRFLVENLSSVKEILNSAADGNSKEYMDLVYKLSLENVPVSKTRPLIQNICMRRLFFFITTLFISAFSIFRMKH